MPERGGPTTQSGLLFQNSIAALYAGRLCDTTERLASTQPLRVQAETSDNTDDIVVTFADGHLTFIQAKEELSHSGDVWRKLWISFGQQYIDESFRTGIDSLGLVIGRPTAGGRSLQEIAKRATTSSSYDEWVARLNSSQRRVLESIQSSLPPQIADEAGRLAFFKHLKIEIYGLLEIERDMMPNWMPPATLGGVPVSSATLFKLIRDTVAEAARYRANFDAPSLRSVLAAHDVHLENAPDLLRLKEAAHACSSLIRRQRHTFGSGNVHIRRETSQDICDWAVSDSKEKVAVLLDHAGSGKTVVLRDVLLRLEAEGTAVLGIKADLQLSSVQSVDQLRSALYLPDAPERLLQRLAARGPAVVLIDQIDALSLSLAHDQAAINVALDFAARASSIPGVKVLLSCRTFDFNADPKLQSISVAKKFHLANLTDEEVGSVLEQQRIDASALPEVTRQLLRTPLHLDLFLRASPEGWRGEAIESLPDLYSLLWTNIVTKSVDGIAPAHVREEALFAISTAMNDRQRTSVPRSAISGAQRGEYESAFRWLTSEGILVEQGTEWTFLHQTFFDYCYARRFVSRGQRLHVEITGGPQGLFARPQLIQVLTYLRSVDSVQYLRELSGLLQEPSLRYHLRDLLIRWFAAVSHPTDEEWTLLRRHLDDDAFRKLFFRGMASHLHWLPQLTSEWLPSTMRADPQFTDEFVIGYLMSVAESDQAGITALLRPFLNHDPRWNNRILFVLCSIRRWTSSPAIQLFEDVMSAEPGLRAKHVHEVCRIAEYESSAACRLIRLLLDESINAHEREKESGITYPRGFAHHLDEFNGGEVAKTLERLAVNAAEYFLEQLTPWLERVCQSGKDNGSHAGTFPPDPIAAWWDRNLVGLYVVLDAIIQAAASLARTNHDAFDSFANRMRGIGTATPQRLLLLVYLAAHGTEARAAAEFLIEDPRRFRIGESRSYYIDSSNLIAAIFPLLDIGTRATLEQRILDLRLQVWPHYGMCGLRRRGRVSLFLLNGIPSHLLSPEGSRIRAELTRKFTPQEIAGLTQPRPVGGFIGSPIALEDAAKMSDEHWLRAIEKYNGRTNEPEHPSFFKGGSQQLSRVLHELTKKNPQRFHSLVQRVPYEVDEYYAQAFISALAESDAPNDWVFDAARHFRHYPSDWVQREIAWALGRRPENIPEDLRSLLDEQISGTTPGNGHGGDDPYFTCINSSTGSALRAKLSALSADPAEHARSEEWKELESIAISGSDVMRACGVESLGRMLSIDRKRAVDLYVRMADGHPAVIRSSVSQNLLYYAMYQSFGKIEPFLRELLNSPDDECQMRGAQLACIAVISPATTPTDEESNRAKNLAAEVIGGNPVWRRGAANIFAANIDGSASAQCIAALTTLLNDNDEQVGTAVSRAFSHIGDTSSPALRTFVESYASSKALAADEGHQLAEYLLTYDRYDPAWTLTVVGIMLASDHNGKDIDWFLSSETLIRLLIRIYSDPTVDERTTIGALNTFDTAMERFGAAAQRVLAEWDQR